VIRWKAWTARLKQATGEESWEGGRRIDVPMRGQLKSGEASFRGVAGMHTRISWMSDGWWWISYWSHLRALVVVEVAAPMRSLINCPLRELVPPLVRVACTSGGGHQGEEPCRRCCKARSTYRCNVIWWEAKRVHHTRSVCWCSAVLSEVGWWLDWWRRR
jgi:hypothetical protein